MTRPELALVDVEEWRDRTFPRLRLAADTLEGLALLIEGASCPPSPEGLRALSAILWEMGDDAQRFADTVMAELRERPAP